MQIKIQGKEVPFESKELNEGKVILIRLDFVNNVFDIKQEGQETQAGYLDKTDTISFK